MSPPPTQRSPARARRQKHVKRKAFRAFDMSQNQESLRKFSFSPSQPSPRLSQPSQPGLSPLSPLLSPPDTAAEGALGASACPLPGGQAADSSGLCCENPAEPRTRRTRTRQNTGIEKLSSENPPRTQELQNQVLRTGFCAPGFCCVLRSPAFWQHPRCVPLRSGPPAFCCVLRSPAFWQHPRCVPLRSGPPAFCCVLRSPAFWILRSAAFCVLAILRSAAFWILRSAGFWALRWVGFWLVALSYTASAYGCRHGPGAVQGL